MASCNEQQTLEDFTAAIWIKVKRAWSKGRSCCQSRTMSKSLASQRHRARHLILELRANH